MFRFFDKKLPQTVMFKWQLSLDLGPYVLCHPRSLRKTRHVLINTRIMRIHFDKSVPHDTIWIPEKHKVMLGLTSTADDRDAKVRVTCCRPDDAMNIEPIPKIVYAYEEESRFAALDRPRLAKYLKMVMNDVIVYKDHPVPFCLLHNGAYYNFCIKLLEMNVARISKETDFVIMSTQEYLNYYQLHPTNRTSNDRNPHPPANDGLPSYEDACGLQTPPPSPPPPCDDDADDMFPMLNVKNDDSLYETIGIGALDNIYKELVTTVIKPFLVDWKERHEDYGKCVSICNKNLYDGGVGKTFFSNLLLSNLIFNKDYCNVINGLYFANKKLSEVDAYIKTLDAEKPTIVIIDQFVPYQFEEIVFHNTLVIGFCSSFINTVYPVKMQLYMTLPDCVGRKQTLEYFLSKPIWYNDNELVVLPNIDNNTNININQLSMLTRNFACIDLQRMVRAAKENALRDASRAELLHLTLNQKHFFKVFDSMINIVGCTIEQYYNAASVKPIYLAEHLISRIDVNDNFIHRDTGESKLHTDVMWDKYLECFDVLDEIIFSDIDETIVQSLLLYGDNMSELSSFGAALTNEMIIRNVHTYMKERDCFFVRDSYVYTVPSVYGTLIQESGTCCLFIDNVEKLVNDDDYLQTLKIMLDPLGAALPMAHGCRLLIICTMYCRKPDDAILNLFTSAICIYNGINVPKLTRHRKPLSALNN